MQVKQDAVHARQSRSARAVRPRREGARFPHRSRRLPHEGRGRPSSTSARPRTSAAAPHYFTKDAAEDSRTATGRPHRRHRLHRRPTPRSMPCSLEARLVKDIQPRFNIELKDDKTFPYLQIRIREDFPRVEFTRKPRRKGVKLYGPFTSARQLRQAIQVLQRSSSSAPARSTSRRATSGGAGSGRACCTPSASAPPRATSASRARTTASRSASCILVLEGKKDRLIRRDGEGDGRGQ